MTFEKIFPIYTMSCISDVIKYFLTGAAIGGVYIVIDDELKKF